MYRREHVRAEKGRMSRCEMRVEKKRRKENKEPPKNGEVERVFFIFLFYFF